MKVSKKVIKVWNERRTRGDVRRLIEYTNASKPTIIKAITHGIATQEIILKISTFYSEKTILTEEEIESHALKLFSNAKTGTKNIGRTAIN